MKKLVKTLSHALAAAVVLVGLAASANAQTVEVNGLGSSALFLEAGLGAATQLGGSCVWSTATNGVVVATDPTVAGTTDTGATWVAWTPSAQPASATTCGNDAVSDTTEVWSYISTDSVVGNRCLFNGCTIKNNGSGTASAGSILGASGEFPLPAKVATALNGATGNGLVVNVAGTDIRPEDAEFSATRARQPTAPTPGQDPCGLAIAGTQYLQLGYANGANITNPFTTSSFHVVDFTLPSTFTVTPVGATPIIVAVNGDASGFNAPGNQITNISSPALAQFLDGTYSLTGQALATPAGTGAGVTVLLREPLSGTYNVMEYNVPNRTKADPVTGYIFMTSQDVGSNQMSSQKACQSLLPTGSTQNPLNIATANGRRKRAIGTGQELAEILDTTNNGTNILGYGFWSAANFKGFAGVSSTHYLTVDGIDPLHATAVAGNPIPTSTSDLANVALTHVQDGSYPIWSLIRFVSVTPAANTSAAALASATQLTVTPANPDFVISSSLTVVRSHFLPPAGAGEPTLADIANGHVGNISGSSCTAPESGGDVGGVVITLANDSAFCSPVPPNGHNDPRGQTGERR